MKPDGSEMSIVFVISDQRGDPRRLRSRRVDAGTCPEERESASSSSKMPATWSAPPTVHQKRFHGGTIIATSESVQTSHGMNRPLAEGGRNGLGGRALGQHSRRAAKDASYVVIAKGGLRA